MYSGPGKFREIRSGFKTTPQAEKGFPHPGPELATDRTPQFRTFKNNSYNCQHFLAKAPGQAPNSAIRTPNFFNNEFEMELNYIPMQLNGTYL